MVNVIRRLKAESYTRIMKETLLSGGSLSIRVGTQPPESISLINNCRPVIDVLDEQTLMEGLNAKASITLLDKNRAEKGQVTYRTSLKNLYSAWENLKESIV